MGWSYNFWRGTFYPEDTPSDQFLTEYSKHFDTVEVNNTFYRIPSEATVTKWKQQTPETFLFAAKFHRVVTHLKMLEDVEDEVDRFLKMMSKFEGQLGPLLFQFPNTFGPKHADALSDFLAELPQRYRYAVEISNEKMLSPRLYTMLKKNNVALVIVDDPSLPRNKEITADFLYIRWKGDRRKVKGTTGKTELDRRHGNDSWAETITRVLTNVKEVFGYFSKYYSGNPTFDAKYLIRQLRIGQKSSK
jgi:uncharacterized protein YecE (DUF72 family)